jgi:hypothetical protein
MQYGCAGANGGLVADTIFISNLPENVTEEILAGLLSDTGAIKVRSALNVIGCLGRN